MIMYDDVQYYVVLIFIYIYMCHIQNHVFGMFVFNKSLDNITYVDIPGLPVVWSF